MNDLPENERLDTLRLSRLIDTEYYFSQNPDVRDADYDPILHFHRYGAKEGRRPNRHFDPHWYTDVYLRGKPWTDPLLLYILEGESKGNRPICYFDTAWFQRTYLIGNEKALQYYLENCRKQNLSPNRLFDVKRYRRHCRELSLGDEPFLHFLTNECDTEASDPKVFDPAAFRAKEMILDIFVPSERTERTIPMLVFLDNEARRLAGANMSVPEFTEGAICRAAAVIAAEDDSSKDLIDKLMQRPAVYNEVVTRVAIRLRFDYSPSLSESFIMKFNGVPGYEDHRIQKELMYIRAMSGDIEGAIKYYLNIKDRRRATHDDEMFAAWLHARKRDFRTANEILLSIHRFAPTKREECYANSQFFMFYREFDESTAYGLLYEVISMFRRPVLQEIEDDIITALEKRRPYLLLRLGDGEGSYTQINSEEEMKYIHFFRANRREFLDIWFGDFAAIDDPEFEKSMLEFNDAIAMADCIGGIYGAAVKHEYAIGSRRGIAYVINTMRKVLDLGRKNPAWAAATPICDLTIHYQLLLSGALHRLLDRRTKLGLVSCHAGLAPALAKRFGIGEIEFFKIPGEKRHTSELGSVAAEGVHWPDRFREIKDELSTTVDRSGQLFLVAAGILGKIYAAQLKRAGAVVLDIGAAADLWMGKTTRTFPNLPEELKLEFE